MIHLIVGNTGSGKTTYSNKLKETTKGIIFSIDKWNNILFLPDKTEKDGLDWFLERIERAESIILSLIYSLKELEQTLFLIWDCQNLNIGKNLENLRKVIILR